MNRLLRREWPLFIVVAVVLVWGWEIVLGQVPAWGATYLQFQPWWHAVAEAYRAGRLPLWNPYAGFGAPLAANPQAAAFSPFVLLAVVFGTAYGLGISLLLHSLLAGAGAYLALRRFGAEPESAALAGVILPLCGALAPRAVFPPFFNTACWIGPAVAIWPRGGRLREVNAASRST